MNTENMAQEVKVNLPFNGLEKSPANFHIFQYVAKHKNSSHKFDNGDCFYSCNIRVYVKYRYNFWFFKVIIKRFIDEFELDYNVGCKKFRATTWGGMNSYLINVGCHDRNRIRGYSGD